MQRLIGFDPSREPVGDRLANLRIAGIALADLGWEGLDPWLKAERALGSAYAQEAMNDSSPNDAPDRRLDVTQPYWTWADVLGHNLSGSGRRATKWTRWTRSAVTPWTRCREFTRSMAGRFLRPPSPGYRPSVSSSWRRGRDCRTVRWQSEYAARRSLPFLSQLGVRLFDFEVRCQALQGPHQ